MPRNCVTACVVSVLLLAGCSDLASDTQPTSTAHESTTIRVAAAADLKYALDDIIAAFESSHPHIDVQPTYGSSGNFYAQLSNEAPFDLYLSADIEYPRRLAEQGLALEDAVFDYAIGQIVLWVRNDSPIDVEQVGIKALLDSSVEKIAMANPQHAPYGRAAEAVLKNIGLYEHVADRLVLGDNISQTAQFVENGAADIGIIALSIAMAPAMQRQGHHWVIPLETYPSLRQGGLILRGVRDREAAESLKEFILSDEGGGILTQYGFLLPPEE